ncbi:hypothetical protein BSL78_04852, partial [Apostichopus japonicus]
PDTKRIFGRAEEPLHGGNQKVTRSEDQIRSREQKTEVTSLRPQGVGFLIQNCRTLQEPVCTIQTKGRDLNQESKWWPTSSAQAPNSQKPKYSQNTTSRGDYVRHTHLSPLATRHSSNPHNYASKGAVPVTHLPSERGPRLLVEHISYQHQYNSRQSPSLPTRGKLHGSFVWDVLHPEPEKR